MKRNLHLYCETLGRIGFAQIRARLWHRVYFFVVAWFPRLQKRIDSLDDKELWDSLSLTPDVRYQLTKAKHNAHARAAAAILWDDNTSRFFFDVKDVPGICESAHIFYSDQVSNVIRRAEEVVRGVFKFDVGEPVSFERDIQWDYCPSGYAEWASRLNSFHYAIPLCQASLYTGDARFSVKCMELMQDWAHKNPVGHLPAWKPMAVSLRILNWVWIYHLLFLSPDLSAEMVSLLLKSFLAHGDFLVRHLEIDQANNHLLFNAAALTVLGTVFPQFKAAERWRKVGLGLLGEYLPDLICADGVYAERSSHYQILVLDLLLKTVLLLKKNGQAVPSAILEQLQDMTEFLVSLRRPDGSLPMLGDSFDESDMCNLRDTLFLAGVFFNRADWCAVAGPPSLQALWVLGKDAVEWCMDNAESRPDEASEAFPVGGYWIMRNVPGHPACHVVIDCGPFGLYRNPAHGHCDALSFDLFYDGHSMIIDPGTYEYGNTKWRHYFRGTSAHNTVAVDDQEQSQLWGKSRVGLMANARCNKWLTTDWFDYFDGFHDGYKRLKDPVIHTRRLFLIKGERPFLFICDYMEGKGTHEFTSNLHFNPVSRVNSLDKSKLVLTFDDSHKFVVIPFFPIGADYKIVKGQDNPLLGWASYRYGTKSPTTVVSTRVTLECPASFGYLLLPTCCGERQTIYNESVLNLGAHARDSMAVQLQNAGCTNVLVLNRELSPVRVEQSDLEASARVLWAQFTRRSTLQTITGIDFSALILHGQPFMQASCPLPWVRVEFDGAKIYLRTPRSGEVVLLVRAPKVLENVIVNGNAVAYTRNGDYIELEVD